MNMALLYRNILKAAARFPSIKRDAIVKDIKLEFRANKARSSKPIRGCWRDSQMLFLGFWG